MNDGSGDGDPPPRQDSLQGRAARGAVWSIAGYGGSQVLRFAGNVVLTRLLFEEAFGLMALVSVYLQGLALFSDLGIGPSIIQNKRGDDPSFLNTAWTLQAGRGVVLWIVACIGAVPFARAYDQPLLAVLLPVSGFAAILGGFYSSKLFTANRHLAMKRLTIIELTSQVFAMAVMLTWAFVDRSLWALVAGGLAGPFLKMVLSHAILPGVRNRFTWDKDAASALFGFGKWIFFSTLLTFLVGQSDRLIFGKMIPIALLGVYNIALMIAAMPSQALSHLAGNVTFPLYSRIVHNNGDLPGVYRSIRWKILLLAGWSLAGLAAGGPTAVRLLYDARYLEAGWMIQLLSIGAWFGVLEATNGAALLALGQAKLVAASSGGKLIGMLVLIPLGHHWFGFPGAVAGYAASDMFRYLVSTIAAHRQGLRAARHDVGLTAMLFGSAALGVYAARWAAAAEAPVLLEAIVVAMVVSAAWVPVAFRTVNDLVKKRRAGTI